MMNKIICFKVKALNSECDANLINSQMIQNKELINACFATDLSENEGFIFISMLFVPNSSRNCVLEMRPRRLDYEFRSNFPPKVV